MPKFDLVILDLDRTIWDHEDVSSLLPPFRRIREGEVEDSLGRRVRLRPGVRSFLARCRREGVILSIASWNKPEKAVPLLELLSIFGYFSYPRIEFHPDKARMIRGILRDVSRELGRIPRTLFVDDMERMVSLVRRELPQVKAVLFGQEVRSFQELEQLVFGGSNEIREG